MTYTCRLDSEEDITVLVGPEEKQFTIQKDFLCNGSTFFSAAINGQFREATERQVRLPEVDVDLFATYVQFVYTKQIVPLDPEEIEKDTQGTKRKIRATELYILADQFGDMLLQNKLIDYCIETVHQSRKLFPAIAITLAYQHLPANSKLRKLSVDLFLASVSSAWLDQNRDDLPKDFLADPAVRWVKGIRKKDIDQFDWSGYTRFEVCEYHEHNYDVPICA